MPNLVLKSVGGKYMLDENGKKILDTNGNPIFEPNWVSDWKGKKVDREKAAVTGRTSGNQLMQKNESGEVLIRNILLSIDAANRSWMQSVIFCGVPKPIVIK